MKTALLSAFVFPGVGHFYLKKRISGTILACAAIGSLYVVISKSVERALQITEKIQRGEIELDVAAITELLSKQPTGNEAQLLNVAWAVLVITWLIGIVDSYRGGRVKGKCDVTDS